MSDSLTLDDKIFVLITLSQTTKVYRFSYNSDLYELTSCRERIITQYDSEDIFYSYIVYRISQKGVPVLSCRG